MKKLMIAAAAAAMIGGVQAAECLTWTEKDECGEKTEYSTAATAYKVAISLKTTDFKKKTKKSECSVDCTYWREQATKKINGLIWQHYGDACDCNICDLLNDDGYSTAFWTKDGAVNVDFSIGVGLIGKDGKKVEAYGYIDSLAWAGFGSLSYKSKDGGNCGTATCKANVKSITGGIAGQLAPIDFEQESDPCSTSCGDCEPIEYENCCDVAELANQAAYGTIKISYDKSTAKKLAKAGEDADITDFYKVPAAAADDLEVGAITIEE